MIPQAAVQTVIVMTTLDHKDTTMMTATVVVSAIAILDHDFRRFGRNAEQERL